MADRALVEVFREMNGGMFPPMTETFERGKTIFFPGDPAERFYFLVTLDDGTVVIPESVRVLVTN